MMKMMKKNAPLKIVSLSGALAMLTLGMAAAQISNDPYSFRGTPGGGPGMSPAGRQAILDEKVSGQRPDNLLRAPSGELLEAQRGPGGTALVLRPGTNEHITQFRPSWVDLGSGRSTDGISYFYPFGIPTQSGAITTWTSRVTSDGTAFANRCEGNPIDVWTGQVLNMGD